MADMVHGILILIGSVLFGLGIQMFFSSRKFREAGIKVQATVIDNIAVESHDSKGTSIMYAPLLEYDVNGKKATYTPNARSNPPAYGIGEKVLIVYSLKNHHDVRIVSFWGIYLGSNILLAFSLPMLFIGIAYFLFKWGII